MRVKLYEWELVRRLKQAARQRIREREIKRATGKWWHRKLPSTQSGRYWWLILVAFRVAAPAMEAHRNERIWLLNLLSLMLAATVAWSTKQIHATLTFSREKATSLYYPISDRMFCEWVLWRAMKRSIWIYAVALGIYVAANPESGIFWWLETLLAPAIAWMVVATTVVLLVPYADAIPKWLAYGIGAAAGGIIFSPDKYGVQIEPVANALPTGWLHVLLLNMESGPRLSGALTMIVPLLGVVAWWSRGRLLVIYSQGAIAMQETSGQLLDIQKQGEEAQQREPEAAPEDGGALEDPVLTQANWQKHRMREVSDANAEFVRQSGWWVRWNWEGTKWIVRAVGWVLNEEEKGYAQFLMGGRGPTWNALWRNSVIATAVAVMALATRNEYMNYAAVIAALVAIGWGNPVMGGTWAATSLGWVSGKLAPVWACYPVSYWTASRTIWKMNLVRIVAWLPWSLTIGVAGLGIFARGRKWGSGLRFAPCWRWWGECRS